MTGAQWDAIAEFPRFKGFERNGCGGDSYAACPVERDGLRQRHSAIGFHERQDERIGSLQKRNGSMPVAEGRQGRFILGRGSRPI